MDRVVAVDFECFYGDDLNVKRQGPVVYASLTDIFMVGIYTPGLSYVGPPQDAPWPEIAGAHWVSHNSSFDSAVFQAALDRKLISATPPSKWSCSADLSSFCGIGRKLVEAVKNSFGVEISKSIRNRAGNRVWPHGFNSKMQADFKEYCLEDARWCYKLWEKWSDSWIPEEEEFADIVRMRSALGINVDSGKLAQVKSILELRVREARNKSRGKTHRSHALNWSAGVKSKEFRLRPPRLKKMKPSETGSRSTELISPRFFGSGNSGKLTGDWPSVRLSSGG